MPGWAVALEPVDAFLAIHVRLLAFATNASGSLVLAASYAVAIFFGFGSSALDA